MKKRSILLTCIVAVMALAMFVGCDNAPVLPSFVVGGTINQTGDFLEGQTFDPSKFTVTITYDNGRIVAADETVSVYLDTDKNSDGKVNAGDTVKADLGKNYADSDICATAGISVYNIKSVEVVGPETIGSNNMEINASDLTVTATYLDSTNSEKTMVLVPGEYTVGEVSGGNVTPSIPEAAASVEVTVHVGNFGDDELVYTYDFTVEYEEPVPVDLPYEITGWASDNTVEFTGILMQLDYGDNAVEPNPSDVTLNVRGDDGEDHTVNAADVEGVELAFVDTQMGLPLASNDLTSVSSVNLVVSLPGVAEQKTLEVETTATFLVVTPVADFALSEGPLGTASASDYKVILGAGGSYYEDITGNDGISVIYVASDSSTDKLDPETVITTESTVYAYANYMGATGHTDQLTITETPAPTVESIEVTLVEGFEGPAAQYYDSLSTLTEFDESAAIESVTYVMSDGSEREFAWADASATAEYYLNGAPLSELEATADGDYDLNVDSLDIHVVYGEVSVDVPVATTDAEATTLEVTATVVKASGATTVVGMDVEYAVVLKNTTGAIDKDYTDIGVLSNGYSAELPATVTAAEQTVTVYNRANVSMTDEVTVEAGASYISAGDLAFVQQDEDALFAVGTEIDSSWVNANFELDAETYDVISGNGIDAEITVGAPGVPAGKVLETGANVIPVTVTYLGSEGTTVTANVNLTVDGVAYVSGSPSFTFMYNNEPITALEDGRSYNVSGFTVNPASYTAVGDNPAVAVTEISTVNDGAYTGSFTADQFKDYVFTVTYTNSSLVDVTKPETLDAVVSE